MNRAALVSLVLICSAATTGILVSGPLDPPAGPIAPTYKTLSEVEPRIAINLTNTPGDANSLFKITQPGSYYLTGNITGVANKHGIEIVVSGVTVDLNGFDLVGVATALDGVSATVVNLTNIEIRNGSVRNWGDEGVDLFLVNAMDSVVRDVRSSGNADVGITAGNGCTISGCTASANNSAGILAGNGCTISGCTSHDNSLNGIDAGFGCTISGCTSHDNIANGITAGNGCTISGCTSHDNIRNGIDAGFGCTISGCTSHDNSANGIDGSNGCTISGCTARTNILNGIQVFSQCTVFNNTCSTNGSGTGNGAGIHATGNDNRIEGNNCTGADRGIDVDATGNIIIKNTCSGNTVNWTIVANNVVGPILDRTAPASAAISGNSAPDSTGSTHPNANFTY
jgi:parallel beta-helix repeat protein